MKKKKKRNRHEPDRGVREQSHGKSEIKIPYFWLPPGNNRKEKNRAKPHFLKV